jgi:DNA-binding SARP family transcriptional activator
VLADLLSRAVVSPWAGGYQRTIIRDNLLRLHTFGGLWLAQQDGSPAPVSQKLRLALLAIVASAGPMGVSRDRVLAWLWADSDDDRARHALAQLTYAMHRSAAGPLLSADTELRLAPQVTSDVGDFLAATTQGRHDEAIALYTGPFLDGFHLPGASEFEHWLDAERDRLRRLAAQALEKAAREAQRVGHLSASADHWRRLVELDPLDPRSAAEYLEALLRSGRRTDALQFAQHYEARVQDELGSPPDRGVREVIGRVRSPGAPDPPPAPPRQDVPAGLTVSSPVAPVAPVGRRLSWAVALMGAVAVGAVVGLGQWRKGAIPVPRVDAVVAWPDRAMPPADSVVVVQAVLASLQRHTSPWLLSKGQVASALVRMRRPDTSAIPDEATAREIAARSGLRFVLLLDAARSSDGWSASYQVEDARSGAVLGTGAAAAAGASPQAALDRLFAAAGRSMATAVGQVTAAEAMPDVTTGSLEALQAYQGSSQLSADVVPGAEAMMQRAVQLDSTFASAHGSLAYSYWFLYDQVRADVHASAALRHMDGLPREERLSVERDVAAAREDWPAAILASRALVARAPGQARHWHALGQYLFFNHEYGRAVAAYDSGLAHAGGSDLARLHGNRATVLARMDRPSEAIAEYERTFALDSELIHHPYLGHEYGVTLVRAGNGSRAREVYIARLDAVPRPGHAYRSLALLEVYEGHLAAASELLGSAVTASLATGDSLGAATGHVLAAAVFMARRRPDEARGQLAFAEPFLLNQSAPYELRARTAKLLARLGATDRARLVVAALERKTTAVSHVARARRLMAQGELEMALGRNREGRASIERALVLDPTNDVLESAAMAAYRDGALAVAARRYEVLGEQRSIDWEGYSIAESGR